MYLAAFAHTALWYYLFITPFYDANNKVGLVYSDRELEKLDRELENSDRQIRSSY